MIERKFRIRNATTKEVVAYELIGIPFNFGYAFYFTNDDKKVYHSNSNELVRACGILCPIRDQFAGLQDVTGKEIYENDIARIQGLDDIYKIEFINGCWLLVYCGNLKKLVTTYYLNAWKNDLIVIGNIYENPELLQ